MPDVKDMGFLDEGTGCLGWPMLWTLDPWITNIREYGFLGLAHLDITGWLHQEDDT